MLKSQTNALGRKSLHRYLGEDKATWNEWDATYANREASERLLCLIDQGEADNFMW